MDTPGLSDVEMRQNASEEITKALRAGGRYKVVFVVNTESGRIRPDDVAMVKLVLESAPEITDYGLIFNKISKNLMKQIDSNPKIIGQMVVSFTVRDRESSPIPFPLFLRKVEEIYDVNDAVADFPELVEFMEIVPLVGIHEEKVENIKANEYEEMTMELKKEIDDLKENNARMEEKMEEDKKRYTEKINNLIAEGRKQYEEGLQRIKEANEKYIKDMNEKEKQHKEEMQKLKEEDEIKHKELLAKMEADAKAAAEKMEKHHKDVMAEQQKVVNQLNSQIRHLRKRKKKPWYKFW